jgi:hypothetical protein
MGSWANAGIIVNVRKATSMYFIFSKFSAEIKI